MGELAVNKHFWAEITPLQYHVKEQCVVHSPEEGQQIGSVYHDFAFPWVAKLVLGDVTVYLDDVNALRVIEGLTQAVINKAQLKGQR